MRESEVIENIKRGVTSFPGLNLLNFRGGNGKTILHLLVEYGQVESAQIILKGCLAVLDVQDTDE